MLKLFTLSMLYTLNILVGINKKKGCSI